MKKSKNSKSEHQNPIHLLTEALNWLKILDVESFAILLKAILTMKQEKSGIISKEASLVFNCYLTYWKAIFELAMSTFQNMGQMFKNTSDAFLTILEYKYSEGKEDDKEQESQDSGEAQNGCGLGDDNGDGAEATTNDVESEDIFDSAEKPQNQVQLVFSPY